MSILRYNPNPLWWWLAFQTHDEGKFCEYRDCAKLEAENARLKAEVERLTKHDDGDCRHFIMRTLLEAQNTFLKSQVERLTKAGDAMASSIQFNEEMSQDYNGPTIVHQSVQRWNAAKGGKQS